MLVQTHYGHCMKSQLFFPILDIDTICRCIPQRPPMLMVDGLLAYAEESVTSSFLIKDDNIFVQDGLLQDVGLIEHMAQSVALHTGFGYFLRQEEAPIGYIGSINNLEIHELPSVGEEVNSSVQIMQEFSGVTLVEIETKIQDKVIAKGQMKTVIAK